MVLSGPRVTEAFKSYWDGLWDGGRHLGGDNVSRDGIEPGDVIINEVMWLGVNSQDRDGNDEFIELRNTTDEWINLDLWQIGNENDFVVGLPPGSRIPPNGTFLILDHTLEPYADGVPQDELSAFSGADLVLNPFNDNRAARLYLKDGQLELFLKDPENNIIDVAGDGGPAFDGGIDGRVLRSMERVSPPGDGADRDSWVACLKTEGGENVNEDFKGEIMATPGEENSQ
ncbi:MAG: hypothetical protein ACJARS_003036 [bacterium]|jgi:hypothetical protein